MVEDTSFWQGKLNGQRNSTVSAIMYFYFLYRYRKVIYLPSMFTLTRMQTRSVFATLAELFNPEENYNGADIRQAIQTSVKVCLLRLLHLIYSGIYY